MAGSPPERVSRGFKGEVKHHSPFEPPSSSRLSSDDSGSEPESSGKMDASTFGYSSGSSPTKSTLDEDMDVGMAEFMRMRAAQVTQPDVLNHRTPSKRKRNDLDDEEANDPTANGGKRNAVQGMMAKMGWSAGTGLGKSGQGRQEALQPVPKSNQLGLGFERAKSKVLDSDLVWQPGEDQVSVTETVEWIPLCTEELPDENKVLSLDDEHTFCDPILLQRLLRCKSALDDESDKEIQEARSKANPFETVGKHFFQNRAALKMANMDRVFDFMFTNPLDSNGKPLVVEASDDLLFFADVCAGPGGFSEYVLWRKQWQSHGFGFTLEGKDDFKLHNFQAGPPEAFEPFHGAEDMNSVYNKNNLTAFANYVHKNTSQNGTTGVHFMMADGGFSVDGQENIQEILSKRLYLCQFLCALMILREGGHFVCKLFDIFTPFSVGLIYLMYRCFKSVCIHKPNTSRPANSERSGSRIRLRMGWKFVNRLGSYAGRSKRVYSRTAKICGEAESATFKVYLLSDSSSWIGTKVLHLSPYPRSGKRYIICKGLHGGWADVRDYLFAMNVQFDVLKPNEDIYHSVPMDYLMDDESFCGYIKRSNET